MMKRYNLRKVRKLLLEGFTAEELVHFCRDMPDFNPVYYQLPQRTSVAVITQQLLAYAEQGSLMTALLDWVRERKPTLYEKYQPYDAELARQYQPSAKAPSTTKPVSPPISDRVYNMVKIRRLFVEGFTAEELEHFCRDMPDFKPVYYQLPQGASNVEIILRLLEYAEHTFLVEVLLEWAKERNVAEYEKYQPYYVELEEKHQPSAKAPPPTKSGSPSTPDKKP